MVAFDFICAYPCWLGGMGVAVLFIMMHIGSVSLTESRLDVSSCVSREEVDHALDCVWEGWDGGVLPVITY
jgi:hypothetical protein